LTDILQFCDAQEVREKLENELQNKSIEFNKTAKKKPLKILTFKNYSKIILGKI